MRKKKILVCLLLFLGYILAAVFGLLDNIPPFSIFSPGNYFFPKIGHAFGYQFLLGLAIDLCFYGVILYGIVSLVFYLIGKYKSR